LIIVSRPGGLVAVSDTTAFVVRMGRVRGLSECTRSIPACRREDIETVLAGLAGHRELLA
jgi:hypothetical protein